ncbi:MAG TPA: DUF4383 domain-containing protein [Gemmatimonadaceae bacterium]|nr:DUF4383 domain-containing protein [Gemmatimonadaceae bacterium]
MSRIQWVAGITGAAFVTAALAGFALTGLSAWTSPVTMATAPRLLGLFPVNPVHNLLHLIIGVWGVLAFRHQRAAAIYAAVSGVIYLLLTALGVYAPTIHGMVPIGGHDILLHFVVAAVLIGFAFGPKSGDQAVRAEENVVRSV